MPKVTTTAQEHEERPLLAEGTTEWPLIDDIPVFPLPMQMLADQQLDRAMTPEVDPLTPGGQAVMSVDEAMYKVTTHAATVLGAMNKSWDHALRALNGNQQVLEALTAAVTNFTPYVPFKASVNVTSPTGFPMRIDVASATREAFVEAINTMMEFLRENEFSPGAPF